MALKLFGISDSNSWFINRKIEITNYGNYLFSLVVLAYFIQYLAAIPDMLWVSYLGFSVSIAVFFLLQKGKHVAARILLSIMPNVLITFSHSYVVSASESLLPQSLIFGSILILTPRMLFHFEERVPMYFSVAMAFFIFVLVFPLQPILEAQADTSSFKEGAGLVLGWVSPFMVLGGFIAFMQMESSSYDNKNKELLAEAENKARVLQEKEEELNLAMQEVRAAMEEDKQRDWITNGITLLSSLQQNFHGQEFYHQYLSTLVNYMEATQGALFLREDQSLRRVSTFAVEDVSELVLKPGEGLAGQAMISRKEYYLQDLPSNYFVSSGLGVSRPKSLVVLPLVFDQEVQGVLEISSIKEFSESNKKLLNRISELLAAQLYNQQLNSKMTAMLQEALKNGELLKQQEEEMRHNMELMQVSQEEFQTKEKLWKKEREELLNKLSKN